MSQHPPHVIPKFQHVSYSHFAEQPCILSLWNGLPNDLVPECIVKKKKEEERGKKQKGEKNENEGREQEKRRRRETKENVEQ